MSKKKTAKTYTIEIAPGVRLMVDDIDAKETPGIVAAAHAAVYGERGRPDLIRRTVRSLFEREDYDGIACLFDRDLIDWSKWEVEDVVALVESMFDRAAPSDLEKAAQFCASQTALWTMGEATEAA
jgi:hypothetical protein